MERLYHYLWKSGMMGRTFRGADGEDIEVIDPGRHNEGSGPDFFNSKLKIGGTLWIGNVEIHIKASDWYRHGHDTDAAYDNVILHVVGISDRRIVKRDGSVLPQAELIFPPAFFNTVAILSEKISAIRCRRLLGGLSPLVTRDWIESLMVERIQKKALKIDEIYRLTDSNWQQTAFILLSRSLGFGLNGDPFEMLSRSIPLTILSHHSDNGFQIQAILFGQAGMLDASLHIFDEYFQNLCREYYFLSRKYGLKPMSSSIWKYARTRPGNFPHRRIAVLAKLCENGFTIFNEMLRNSSDIERLYSLLDVTLDGYWASHFSFDTPGTRLPLTLSKGSKNIIIINAMAPLIYLYALKTGDLRLEEKAFDLLTSLPAENNTVIRDWQNCGIKAINAGESQALLHLKKEYCDMGKCFCCRFGMNLLAKSQDD